MRCYALTRARDRRRPHRNQIDGGGSGRREVKLVATGVEVEVEVEASLGAAGLAGVGGTGKWERQRT